MDLLGSKPVFNLQSDDFTIYSRNMARPPHRIGSDGKVVNSLVTEGCEIEGTVENSVLSSGVKVGKGAVVRDSVIMEDTVIDDNSQIYYSMIDGGVNIGKGCVIGKEKGDGVGITVIAKNVTIEDGTVVPDGVMADGKYFAEIRK